ncbi:MAG: VOC family protein [Rhodobacter sp.]|nr:VOC family protein [Rhodobacter sp.]
MPFTPSNALVWCEIPVSDLEKAVAFYSKVFGYEMTIDENGPNPMAFLPVADPQNGTAGHLYPGKPPAPGTGPTLHLAVPDTVEAARDRLIEAGGASEGPIIPMDFGRWCYATDPDGNSLGLFQFAG